MLRMMCLAGLATVFVGTTPVMAKDASFVIERKGEPIGRHSVTVRQDGDDVIATTEITMRVKFGPIPVFRYNHQSTEVWRDGELMRIDSITDDNGKDKSLRLRREGDAFRIAGTAYEGEAPLTAAPSSYWNKDAMVSAEVLIDTQSGRLIDVAVEPKGAAPAAATEGGSLEAEKYVLSGSVDLSLWYAEEHWVGAEFTVRGEDLKYLYDTEARLASTR